MAGMINLASSTLQGYVSAIGPSFDKLVAITMEGIQLWAMAFCRIFFILLNQKQ
jgi:hypothetical protein